MIAMSILDRIHAIELLGVTVTKNVEIYCKKHSIELEALLVDYCREMMDISHGPFVGNWEPRIIVLLEFIKSLESKAEVVLEAMRRTNVPWSDSLDKYIKLVISDNAIQFHQEINEQYKLMKLRKMILKYGIKNFSVTDIPMVKKIVPYILRQVDVLEALQDALQVCN